MATFTKSDYMTLSQALEYQRYNYEAAFLADLEKESRLMQLMPWYLTSDGSVHKGARATALPEGRFSAINKAVPTGYGATTEYSESVGVYELASYVDTRILEGRSTEDAARIRAGKDRMQLLGFMQGLAKEIINNPGTDADAVKGLIPRRPAIDGKYCLSMGGTGNDVGSIIFVRFGENGVSCRYPSASSPAFSLRDLGEVQAAEYDATGAVKGFYPAMETLARCSYTVDIASDKAFVRVANVPMKTALTSANVQMLIDVINVNLDRAGDGYVAFAPKEVISQFQKYLLDKNNIYFTQRGVEGMGAPVHIFGVPVFYEEFMATEGQVS